MAAFPEACPGISSTESDGQSRPCLGRSEGRSMGLSVCLRSLAPKLSNLTVLDRLNGNSSELSCSKVIYLSCAASSSSPSSNLG